jgi:uncharacterized RDD family membrane protein YckC
MQGVMNAFAQTSARAQSGSKLDNRRVLAALIDLAIVGAGGAAILFAAGVVGGEGASLGAPLIGVVVGWALYYYFACESGGGQTVGKKLMRLRVARVDGGPAELREIAVRTVLRVVDTALVGLIAMMATGERRARLGDLAAGTMIVSTDGAPAQTVAVSTAAEAPVAPEAAEADVETVPHDEELAEVVDAEPVVEYEPITREDPVDVGPVVEVELVEEVGPVEEMEPAEEASPVVDIAPVVNVEPVVEIAPVAAPEPTRDEPVSSAESATSWVAKDPAGDAVAVETEPRVEVVVDPPPADSPPVAEHTLDVATPALKELAQDVAGATGSERAAEIAPEPVVQVAPEPVVEVAPPSAVQPEPRPLAEVEIGGPEIDVDEPQVTVRSVDTVSAIDLVMGAGEPAGDRQAADDPPAGA